MPKELIVSVNGREKKIAIIENEQVTEFYIERGEEHQGIVGNIYKGRVMRVLPGMQSAFVDIGLERDAFLYVSDFFDEEEEFERIVMDKSKSGAAQSRAEAERVAAERIEQSRAEREQHIEAAQERVEPLIEAEPLAMETAEEPTTPTSILETAAETLGSVVQTVADAFEQATDADGGGRRRGRRGRRRGRGGEQEHGGAIASDVATHPAIAPEEEDIATPFAVGGSSFQRVIDEDERAAEDGAMLKDAILQERIFDQIHAVEFDMDTAPSAQVGSLLSQTPTGGSFQRIDDSDIASDMEQQETSPVQQAVAAHVNAFIDEVAEEMVGAQSFERVSDDEGAVAVPAAEEETAASETGSKRGRSARRSAKRKDEEAASAEEMATALTEAESLTGEADEDGAKPKRTGRKKAATKTASKKTAAKAASKKSRSRRAVASTELEGETDSAVLEGEAERAEDTDVVAAEAADGDHFAAGTGADEEAYADAEASINPGRSRGEFATRRGGRRRRRPAAKHEASSEEERSPNGSNGEAEAATVVDETPAAPAQREHSWRDRQDRPREDRRADDRGSRGHQRRERPPQPTITDLLREGQEVLVQIAKEPIAKKGARITSHIALPGRYLVYMPTVEHVGVSRKIESDSERARLRKLIQLIRAEEDVPSGGFIVRTAGVGISEEDLRNDARYLVRTWLDIRRSAEKMKAPALTHRDLDLVQRILRDQLSDDFTAIRVDSEEEYLRIVEFINRIQPRMVSRVKLYTRETPILEAYGVQAEIDKAIKPRVWLRSGGYLVINQTEALVAIDVNTGKFVGRGGSRLEDTITKTNLEAVEEIVRQIRLRDLGGIIVLDLIDMEDRRNRNRVMQALQEALQSDKSPTKVLSFNDFGLVIMTRKRVKQSLERTLCAPCPYCTGAGLVKSPQTICYEILEEARRLARGLDGDGIKQTTLRINPEVARTLRSTERDVLTEIEDYLGAVDITSDPHIHQEQFDFAFV